MVENRLFGSADAKFNAKQKVKKLGVNSNKCGNYEFI